MKVYRFCWEECSRYFGIGLLAFLLSCGGCSAPQAQLYAWVPPKLDSAANRRLLLAKVVGPEELARQLEQAMLASIPRETAGDLLVVTQNQLQAESTLQLVSAVEHMPSDVALLAEAKRRGFDALLFGELITAAPESDRLIVSWRLLDVHHHQRPSLGAPVSVAAGAAGDEAEPTSLQELALQSWNLLLPSVEPFDVRLAEPRWLPGSARVRQGNQIAAAGRWNEAAAIWEDVARKHPVNHAALHNLALAQAAAQQFPEAKKSAQRALRAHRSKHYNETVVWIEHRQRDLADAFQLAPPAEGWLFFADPQSSPPVSSTLPFSSK